MPNFQHCVQKIEDLAKNGFLMRKICTKIGLHRGYFPKNFPKFSEQLLYTFGRLF